MSCPLPPPAPPGLRRSIQLFRAFLGEQDDPEFFYRLLARDSVEQVRRHCTLSGRTLLDVGGGPGYYRDAFRAAGASYVTVDADPGELHARARPGPGTVLGSALALPVRTASVDICYSSNVLEHVSSPWAMTAEMLRATRPGGYVFVSFTNWLSPWGGHETSPWHYLGGHRAAQRYERRRGRPPKNRYGDSLFAVSVAAALAWGRAQRDAEVIAAIPRYHPPWANWVVRVPGLREIATWNLLLVLRRR